MALLADTTVLVSGASGYIGAHVVKTLLDRGYNVRGTVRSMSNKSKIEYLQVSQSVWLQRASRPHVLRVLCSFIELLVCVVHMRRALRYVAISSHQCPRSKVRCCCWVRWNQRHEYSRHSLRHTLLFFSPYHPLTACATTSYINIGGISVCK